MKTSLHILGTLASHAARYLEQWTDLNPGKDALAISAAATGIEQPLTALLRDLESMVQMSASSAAPDSESLERTLAILATQSWKMSNRMIDPETKEARETLDTRDCRGVARALEAIMDELRHFGITITDYTSQAFDQGLDVNVVQGQPREGLTKPTIIETLKPSIFLHQRTIQRGDIIVGLPTPKDSHEPTNH